MNANPKRHSELSKIISHLSFSSSLPSSTTLRCCSTSPSSNKTCTSYARWAETSGSLVHALLMCVFNYPFTQCAFPFLFPCVQRLSSLLILSQLVNQFTEVVVPYIVDRFYSSSQNELKEDDPAADHMQAEGSLPPFPVNPSSQHKTVIRNLHRH